MDFAVQIGAIVVACIACFFSYQLGHKNGRKAFQSKLVGILDDAVKLLNDNHKQIEDTMTDGHEIDEFLKTHKCEHHKPVKSASERRRIAESLKATKRNRKPTGQFAKGSKKV